jgi:hypothetical protein
MDALTLTAHRGIVSLSRSDVWGRLRRGIRVSALQEISPGTMRWDAPALALLAHNWPTASSTEVFLQLHSRSDR